jgi:galactose mutarotase-like enzyme
VRLRAGDWEAVFLPELGMLGASLKHRGAELLSLHGGVAAYHEGHTTGLPLLAPWANRLSRKQFRVAGVDVDHRRLRLHRDPNGLAIHGTMTAAPGWEVVREEPARLVARFDYQADRAFPFPHELTIDAQLRRDGLTLTTSVEPTGRRRVPVSFGWHPYFRVPGPRRSWVLGLPACARLELDAKGIPNGKAAPIRAERLTLGDRSLDDLFALARTRRFTLAGRGRTIEVRFGRGYDYAQIYAPAGRPLVAIEPMTAPTDALVSGAAALVDSGAVYSAMFLISSGGQN